MDAEDISIIEETPAPEPVDKPRAKSSVPRVAILLGGLALSALIVLQVMSLIGLNRSQTRIDELQDDLQSMRADVLSVAGDVGEVSGSIDELELALAVGATGGSTSTAGDQQPQGNQPQAATGVINEISGTEFYSGQTVSYTPADGKARVYMVWAHWCPYCQQDLDTLNTWYAANKDSYPNTELVTVTTFMDDTRSNPLEPYLQQMQFPFPVLMDESQRLTFDLGNSGSVPYWLFVGPDGEVLGNHSGALGEESIAQIFDQVETIAANA
ncbi:MAG: TlpA family protein disulfide reductase [Acidimicrobiia bacterium]|nr:TlpA family protein disulfide reductase [Acidimicrobiia bacterium]NNC76146.1 TlpA family protein disulfide reductase [Acidimicrobiia bacterium]